MNPLDQPITRREILEAADASRQKGGGYYSFADFVEALENVAPEHTDYVRVAVGLRADATAVACVAGQPLRRVQAGDLVTAVTSPSNLPRVTRVREIDVPKPEGYQFVGTAVAFSPEDAERIESAIGLDRLPKA